MAAEVVGLELSGPRPDEPTKLALTPQPAQPSARPLTLGGEAFAELYRTHFGPLSGYAAALTGDPVAAVDIAQEAFTRLLARWRRVRDARAWLFFVATNLTRDYWRGVVRDRELTERAGANHHFEAPAADPWLRDLVERLPEKQRQAILLHYYADISVDDIARLLRVPVGTVKRRLHDGRASLAVDVRGGLQ
jgi:RNA polymerase sigma-70 factor (ECF subfamily)